MKGGKDRTALLFKSVKTEHCAAHLCETDVLHNVLCVKHDRYGVKNME